MKPTRRDLLAVAVIALLLGVLLLSGVMNKARPVPGDASHRPLLWRLAAGGVRAELERECTSCHSSGGGTPLSSTHPPKEQCLICHPVTKE